MANPIALTMIVVYLVSTTLVGIWMVRRSRGSDDWSVAGGRMGILMIAVGIAGTRIGGAATYGVAGGVIVGDEPHPLHGYPRWLRGRRRG